MKILHLRSQRSRMPGGVFAEKLKKIATYDDIPFDPEMPEEQLIDLIGQYDVLLTIWGHFPIPPALAKKPGNLKYICNVSGTLKDWVPQEIIDSHIIVTNWGDAPANSIAEGAMALLLAALKDIPTFVLNARQGINGRGNYPGGTLYNARVAIYGMGVIALRFVEMIRPFGAKLYVYDPYVDTLPEGCVRVDSLDALCANADILVVHAGRSEETDYSITAKHLAMLPDNGVIVNTARWELFNQKDLFEALKDGRLRAGIDVMDGDHLPKDESARQYPNMMYTSHQVGAADWPPLQDGELPRMYEVALENLTRFKNGEAVKFVMDAHRYARST